MGHGAPVLDFFDLDMFARGTPHDAFAQLREHAPVSWHRLVSGKRDDGFWLVTKHADICAVSKNPALYFSHGGSVLVDAPPATAPPHLLMVRDGFCHLDAPVHPQRRKLVMPLFAPRAMGALETRIRARAIEAIDYVVQRGEIDLVADLAVKYPTTVVYMDLLGFSDDMLPRAAFWGDFFNRVHAVPPTDREFASMIRQADPVLREMHQYCLDVLRARREAPKEDVLSVLAHMRTSDGEPLSDDAFISYFWSLTTGAYDTTASTIAGGILALDEFRDQRAKLFATPDLIPTAIEEMLRWVTPVIYFRRTAAQDHELRGNTIKRGQRVAMCYAAADRDPDVFANADSFDIARTPNEHLAFGYGTHFCLGAHLARLELRLLFEELLARGLWFELRGPVTRARSNFINRITAMPAAIVPLPVG